MTLRKKLLLFGVLVSFIPMMLCLTVSGISNTQITNLATEKNLFLINMDLDHIVSNVMNMCQAQNGIVLQMLSSALKLSNRIIDQQGNFSIKSDKKVQWNAINQFTKESIPVTLSGMYIGSQWFEQNKKMQIETPLVDTIKKLTVESCTIFQRMNEKGDMLRIATNIEKLDGTRAIGTFIPAQNPDGTDNAVVSTLLKGKTFTGRAFVVNAWFFTAYEPIFDENKNVIGALYVGIKQKNIEQSLLEPIASLKIGASGYVYVLNSKGDYIISKNNAENGKSCWNAKDANGNFFVQEMVKNALSLKADESSPFRYQWKNKGEESYREKIVKLKYYKEWDWIIGASAYEDEMFEAKNIIINKSRQTNFLMIILSGFFVMIAALYSYYFSGKINSLIGTAVQKISDNSNTLFSVSNEMSNTSQSLAEGATQQAATIEETSSSLEELSSMIKKNADNASQADSLMNKTGQLIKEANDSMQELTSSMKEISKASEETTKIIKTIDEIAFQTNLLALNAAVEAARAGEAGAGFAVVADEVRNLAMRASEAARNTSNMLEETEKKVKSGSEIVLRTNENFSMVDENSNNVLNLVTEIASANKEQASGIDQITSGVKEMDAITQNNSSNAEKTASSAQVVDAKTNELNSMVNQLKEIIG